MEELELVDLIARAKVILKTKQLDKTNSLNTEISDIGLSVRAMMVCYSNNITTVEELVNMTKNEFRSLKNVGAKSIQEIDEYFEKNNLNWKP